MSEHGHHSASDKEGELIEYRLGELERQFLAQTTELKTGMLEQGKRLEQVHQKLIELEARMCVPGTSAVCLSQNMALASITTRLEAMEVRLRTVDDARLLRVEARLSSVETRTWMWSGGLGVLMIAVTLFGPALRAALHLTP